MAPKRTLLIEGSFWISVSGTIPFIVPGKKQRKMSGWFLPRATLALVASWLIQKETQESMTMRMEGRYVWKTK